MKLYSISDKGKLIELNKLDFAEDDLYLIDDDQTLYIWIGKKVSRNRQDLGVKKARDLDKERGGSLKLLLLNQNREYGAFSAMMDELREGLDQDGSIARRYEFILKEPVKKSVEESVEEPIKEPVEEPIKESVEEPIKEPVEEPIKEPVEEPIKESVEEPIKEPVEEPIKEPVEEPVEEPVKEKVEKYSVDWLNQLQESLSKAQIKSEPKFEPVKEPESDIFSELDAIKPEPESPKQVSEQKEIKPEPVAEPLVFRKTKVEEPKLIEEPEVSSESEGLIMFRKPVKPEKPIVLRKVEKPSPKVEEAPEAEMEHEEDFNTQVNVAAYYISQNHNTYDELCWMLAERQLKLQRGNKVPEDMIKKYAEIIFETSCTYDELCWLIGEMQILVEKNYIEIPEDFDEDESDDYEKEPLPSDEWDPW